MPAAGTLSFDTFLNRRAADRRLARLTHDIALPAGRGLEFGACKNPTPLPEAIEVTYIDYSKEAATDVDGAVSIDHAWAGIGSLSTLLGRGAYDFAIAAQVAQYVPNLLGWLRGIHAALRPGGVLNLSLPDKRFMFDAARPVSTLAELLEADLLSYERPSPRQLFAHSYEARSIAPEQIWRGSDPVAAPRMAGDYALANAYDEASSASASNRYVLCHCWVFTPAAFLDRVEEATRLGLFPFVLNQLSATEPGQYEFFVSMRRDTQDEPEALQQMQAAAISHLRSIVIRQSITAALIARS